MKRRAPDGEDMFGNELQQWLDPARSAWNKLGCVKNSYVGNKRKMLVDFAAILHEVGLKDTIKTGKVLDLFSGSAFVGYFFKRMGAAVWSNEILASSYLNALCFVENNDVVVSGGDIISRLQPNESAVGVAHKYIDSRFSEEEAKTLDSFLRNIESKTGPIRDRINETESVIKNKILTLGSQPILNNKDQYADCMMIISVMHYVMDRCYVGGRLNRGQVLAGLSHRIKHARNKGMEMSFSGILPYNLPFSNGRQCIATKMDAIELLEKYQPNVDIVYVDPPYGGQQSDYSAMYSFFEEYLGFPQEPGSARFVKSKTYNQMFADLLSKLPPSAVWIFSYNDDSWADLNTIESHIRSCGRTNIVSKKIDYKYNYRSKDKATGTEYVIVAHP